MDIVSAGLVLCAVLVVAGVGLVIVRFGGDGLRGADAQPPVPPNASDLSPPRDAGPTRFATPLEPIPADAPPGLDAPPPGEPSARADDLPADDAGQRAGEDPGSATRRGRGRPSKERRSRRGGRLPRRRREEGLDPAAIDWDALPDVVAAWTDELRDGPVTDIDLGTGRKQRDEEPAAERPTGIRKVGQLEVGSSGWVLGVAAAVDGDGQLRLRTDFNVYAVPTPLTTLRVIRTPDGFTVEGTPLGTGRPGWDRGPTVRALLR